MKSDANVNIKELLESGSYIVVLDTNVFLSLYRDSPDYADFILGCLDTIKGNIVVPKTVQIEFIKHNKTLFDRRQKTIESFIEESVKLVRSKKKR